MDKSASAPLMSAVDAYIKAPTGDNRDKLIMKADEYRELWIVDQASRGATSKKGRSQSTPTTTYHRQLEVMRAVDGIPIKLALQERRSASVDKPWWTLSWRTKLSPDGPNRRFYLTNDRCWTIPAAVALEMIEEMDAQGGLDERYFDHRQQRTFETLDSTGMTPDERADALEGVTAPDEDWGSDPFLVLSSDPNDAWKKVLIVDTDTETATFRSITKDPDYMPKKVLRRDAEWWLDNSMMDANVQQMRAFYSCLRDHLSSR